MDYFKRKNVKLATSLDYNASRYVSLGRDRRRVAQLLRRYARRKLREELSIFLKNNGV